MTILSFCPFVCLEFLCVQQARPVHVWPPSESSISEQQSVCPSHTGSSAVFNPNSFPVPEAAASSSAADSVGCWWRDPSWVLLGYVVGTFTSTAISTNLRDAHSPTHLEPRTRANGSFLSGLLATRCFEEHHTHLKESVALELSQHLRVLTSRPENKFRHKPLLVDC